MYTDRDRASTSRVVLTIAGIIAAVFVVIGAAYAAIGAMYSEPATEVVPVSAPAPAPVVPEQVAPVEDTPATLEPTASAESMDPEPVEPQAQVAAEPGPAPAPQSAPTRSAAVVVIDPGHQRKADLSLEPIGPGASAKKPKVQGGTSGVATGNSESSINLKIAKKLRDKLEARGVTVIMVRDSQNVNVANSKRAKIANEANADLFVRLHCDGAPKSATSGLSTLVPAKNKWTGPIVSESKKAGRLVHKAVVKASGAKDRGVVPRSDLSGFNWSKVPTILVEMGFMSNPAEDRRLGTSAYQDKLAEGMADGIVDYIGP